VSKSTKGAGDPSGRRIALRKSVLAEEAGHAAHLLTVLMRRCGLDSSPAQAVAQDLLGKSVTFAEQATGGRVMSRLSTKKTGHPLLSTRSLNSLYLDESGTAAIHPAVPVFALGGVSVKEEDEATYVRDADALKMKFFGSTGITFHEPYMQ
jgi:hypothetical protein